jgi:hypothetical protein
LVLRRMNRNRRTGTVDLEGKGPNRCSIN